MTRKGWPLVLGWKLTCACDVVIWRQTEERARAAAAAHVRENHSDAY